MDLVGLDVQTSMPVAKRGEWVTRIALPETLRLLRRMHYEPMAQCADIRSGAKAIKTSLVWQALFGTP
jgi:hypothetical protein